MPTAAGFHETIRRRAADFGGHHRRSGRRPDDAYEPVIDDGRFDSQKMQLQFFTTAIFKCAEYLWGVTSRMGAFTGERFT